VGEGEGNCHPPKIFGKPWKFGQTLGKIKKIRADLSENMLKSGYFITILRKNSGKLSTAPPPTPLPRKHQPRSPMLASQLILLINDYTSTNHSLYMNRGNHRLF
jgi:hypothetical protein